MEKLIDPGDVPDIENVAASRLLATGQLVGAFACENILQAEQAGLLNDLLPTANHTRDALAFSIAADRRVQLQTPELVAS